MDPKVIMFQTVAKMLGVSPEMLMSAVETVATGGDTLKRVEAKLDALTRYIAERDGLDFVDGRAEPDRCRELGNGYSPGGLPLDRSPEDI